MTVQLRLRCFEHERTSLLGCLDHLPAAAFLLDAEGRVARTNAAAEALVASGRALRCVRGRLRCALPADERRLAQRVDEALRRAVAGDGRDVVAIQRPEGGPPLEAMVTRLAGPEAAEAGAPVVAVFVRDPLASPPAPTELLRRLYGLTRAEARLAALIGEGLAPADAAERLGITTQTARSQLKTIFQKTQTNRQAALVRLLAGAPFRLLPAESADSQRRRG